MPDIATNAHEFSVTELSGAIRRSLEDGFGQVRVRGEMGRVTLARSGHVYVDLKDAGAVLAAVMWKGVAAQLRFRPEEGMEVVATGRISTFPGSSKYQLIIDRLEPAGVGALLLQLEERRKRLATEGLFDAARKRPLPVLPAVIGVVTSPTGAVIRDILHRVADRFPMRVILWPTLVQGERAAGQIAAAIEGFNALSAGGLIPRPDVLIVARGGGSIEDLWAFNEEIVVRAAAASAIPLISAVGHETDTTLIDFAADLRAPTPTGAAEKAVPVRAELLERVSGADARLTRAAMRGLENGRTRLRAATARLPRPEALLQTARQRLDLADARLAPALRALTDARRIGLERAGARLRPDTLRQRVAQSEARLGELSRGIDQALIRRRAREVERIAAARQRLELALQRLSGGWMHGHKSRTLALEAQSRLLSALDYNAVLGRGFALVRDARGRIVSRAAAVKAGQEVSLQFADTALPARILPPTPVQGSLFDP